MGEFEYRIDEKGRIPVPPKFRRELRDGVVLAPRRENCLTVYPLAEQKKLAACNLLARLRSNGLGSEYSQSGNKGSIGGSGRV